MRQTIKQTALQARRVCTVVAVTDYALLFDSDNELYPEAAEPTQEIAQRESAVLVVCSCHGVSSEGKTGEIYERAFERRYPQLDVVVEVRSLLPVGKTAQG